jgi:Restriction endonuclease fold toxin 5
MRFIAGLLALISVLMSVSAPAAWAVGDTDGGPGVWGPSAPGGAAAGSRAYIYEGQINGRGAQFNYWVPYPETRQQPGFDINTWEPWNEPVGQPRSGAAFDGWDRAGNRLLDAKGEGYARLLDPRNAKWFDVGAKLEDEALRQKRAADNTPIRWHFAEEGAHQRMADRLSGIETTVTRPGTSSAFTAPGSPADPDGMASPRGPAAARPPARAPGGIDFSTLQLRHVSTGSVGANGIGYSVKTPSAELSDGDFNAVQDASDAFFVWLELNPSQFWVNLNPGQPDQIIDPDLALTDVGRVMLLADLQLKTNLTQLVDPAGPLGDEFYRRIIVGGPDEDFCVSVRYWISPAPATVRDTGSELYILDAPLNVMAETLYSVDTRTGGRTCPDQTPQRAQYNESVVRSVLLPSLVEAVNNDPEYADLRRVYMSRVAAEWYRQVSATQDTFYKSLINDGIVGPYVSQQPWDPMDVFNDFVSQLYSHEFEIEVGGFTYTFLFGGVDMSEAPADPMPAAEFTEQYPLLPATVEESIEKATQDPDGQTIWAGGRTVLEAVPPAAAPEQPHGLAVTGTSMWIWMSGLLLCVGGVLLIILARRWRRQPSS